MPICHLALCLQNQHSCQPYFHFTLQPQYFTFFMKFKFFLPSILWFVIVTVLLTLPGDDFPDSGFFDIPFFDKYVHFGIFSLLTFLFCFPFAITKSTLSAWKSISIQIAVYAIVYGVAMEYVQRYFIKGRSFDLMDIFFDSIGSTAGLLAIWELYILKKIGPDRNRGRNQN